MLVDEHYRECVCFLCVPEMSDAGGQEFVPRATGFFVAIQPTDGLFVYYLITARHVLDASMSKGKLYAKINLRGGGITYLEVAQPKWHQHPSTDVAAIRVDLNGEYRVNAVPFELLRLSSEDLSPFWRVDPGDDVFFIGLFYPFSGDDQAEPIVRRGHVALGLRKVPLKANAVSVAKKVDGYLVETRSWGGESGSPVFHCKWPNSPTVPISTTRPGLIGLLHGHFDIPATNADKSERIALNSGIGVVIPSDAIAYVLDDPDFISEREQLVASLR